MTFNATYYTTTFVPGVNKLTILVDMFFVLSTMYHVRSMSGNREEYFLKSFVFKVTLKWPYPNTKIPGPWVIRFKGW